MPGDGSLFHLDRRPSRPLSVVLEDLLDFGHPAHVESLSHVDPFVTARHLDERAVFGGKTEVRYHTPVFLQESAVSSRNEPDDILGILTQVPDRCPGSLGRDSLRGNLDDRGECALYA